MEWNGMEWNGMEWSFYNETYCISANNTGSGDGSGFFIDDGNGSYLVGEEDALQIVDYKNNGTVNPTVSTTANNTDPLYRDVWKRSGLPMQKDGLNSTERAMVRTMVLLDAWALWNAGELPGAWDWEAMDALVWWHAVRGYRALLGLDVPTGLPVARDSQEWVGLSDTHREDVVAMDGGSTGPSPGDLSSGDQVLFRRQGGTGLGFFWDTDSIVVCW